MSWPTCILRELQKAGFFIIIHDLLSKFIGLALFSRHQLVKYMEDAGRTWSTAELGSPKQPGREVRHTSPAPGGDQRARGQRAAHGDHSRRDLQWGGHSHWSRVDLREGTCNCVPAERGSSTLLPPLPCGSQKHRRGGCGEAPRQVLCYRKGSDCSNLCSVHLHKPISSGFTEEKSMSPSHVEDNHSAH